MSLWPGGSVCRPKSTSHFSFLKPDWGASVDISEASELAKTDFPG